jgi:hypothetical protein
LADFSATACARGDLPGKEWHHRQKCLAPSSDAFGSQIQMNKWNQDQPVDDATMHHNDESVALQTSHKDVQYILRPLFSHIITTVAACWIQNDDYRVRGPKWKRQDHIHGRCP